MIEGDLCIESQDTAARSPPQRCLKAAVSHDEKMCLALTLTWKCARASRGGDTVLLSAHLLWEDAGSALGSLHLQLSLHSQGLNSQALASQLFLGKIQLSSCPSS